MSEYREMLDKTIENIRAQIDDAVYKGEKHREGQLRKQLADLLGSQYEEPPGACL